MSPCSTVSSRASSSDFAFDFAILRPSWLATCGASPRTAPVVPDNGGGRCRFQCRAISAGLFPARGDEVLDALLLLRRAFSALRKERLHDRHGDAVHQADIGQRLVRPPAVGALGGHEWCEVRVTPLDAAPRGDGGEQDRKSTRMNS